MKSVARAVVLLLIAMVALVVPGSVGVATAAPGGKAKVTSVGTGSGPLAPTRVVLRGKRLGKVTAVRFGKRKATSLQRLSRKSISVVTPRRGKPGTVSVRVKTKAGWSRKTRKARYTFVGAPQVTGLSPASGGYAGGTRVVLSGTRLATTSQVTFGGQPARIVSRGDSRVVVTTPVGVLGRAAVSIRSAGGAAGAAFTYTSLPARSSYVARPAAGTLTLADVQWVTGGLDRDTGQQSPWVVSLAPGAATPAVGQQVYLAPGDAALPNGLAGVVRDVASQVDESTRVTVDVSDLRQVFGSLQSDYQQQVVSDGLLTSVAGTQRASRLAAIREPAFPMNGSAIDCTARDGSQVSFGAELSSSVTDLDVSQHVDAGSAFRKPAYDATLTAEVTTSGKLTVAAAATCKLRPPWRNAHRTIIPLGGGASVSFGPTLTIKVSGKGTWGISDRTRHTVGVAAVWGETPRYTRASRTVSSKQTGALSVEVEVSAGVSVQLGILDRAGAQGKLELAAASSVEASGGEVCVDGTLAAKLSLGVFLDVFVARWEADAASWSLRLLHGRWCAGAEPSSSLDEAAIASGRLPDARVGQPYASPLETTAGRGGRWSVPADALPSGLSLNADTGVISGTPVGPVFDYAVLVTFDDGQDAVTSVVWIRVMPEEGIGGGDIQATLRWTGAADLDLHVTDPFGEEIYYNNDVSASGGQLDHDANANCNGITDDDNAVENIFWPTGESPAGTYQVRVDVYADCGAPLDWELVVRRGGAVILDEVGSGDSDVYEVSLGSSLNRSAGVRRVAPTEEPATAEKG